LKQIDEYWAGTTRLARMWVTPDHETPYRPYLTLLLSQQGKILISKVLEQPPAADALFELLLRAMRSPALDVHFVNPTPVHSGLGKVYNWGHCHVLDLFPLS
jgi:hypothetical protein